MKVTSGTVAAIHDYGASGNASTTVKVVVVPADADTINVDVLIVGFGFSVIPLVRELDRNDRRYTIICDRNSVWDRLQRADRLDFDLVSSYYTSFYSFDLVGNLRKDGFPTAQEFCELQNRYYDAYQDKITGDFVEVVRNYEAFSIVQTRRGRTYKASQLVISTAFRRRITEELAGFDYGISGKTIVFNTVGDSANLMISKLVPGNNEIICLHNGFVPIDKIMSLNGVTFTLDQLEFHNFGFHFRRTYRNLVGGGFCSLNIINSFLAKALQVTFLAPLFCRYNFQTLFGVVREHELDQFPTTPLPNGVITVKYWPIDKYAEEFSGGLHEAISKGYLLNDIAFFANEGLIKLWPRHETEIDRDDKSVAHNGQRVEYDYFVEADTEAPNLPRIIVVCGEEESDFEYRYRDNFYGVVPSKLSNIYFLGLTRPTTGGLANITEMQCLLVHKLLTDNEFRRQTRATLAACLDNYNRSHYLQKESGKTDHVVWYGSYTEEVARLLGINIRLRDCKSLKALNQYFFLPNNAFKYRQAGEYRVDGCDKLADHVYREHRKYHIIHYYVMTFVLYRLLFLEYSVLLYAESTLSLGGLVGLVVLQLLFAKLFVIPTQNYFGLFKVVYLSLGAIAMALFGSMVFLPFLLVDFGHTFFVRQKGFRHMFNDLKNKPRYRGFFKRYLEAYSEVGSRDGTL
jgi:hypothetical protein